MAKNTPPGSPQPSSDGRPHDEDHILAVLGNALEGGEALLEPLLRIQKIQAHARTAPDQWNTRLEDQLEDVLLELIGNIASQWVPIRKGIPFHMAVRRGNPPPVNSQSGTCALDLLLGHANCVSGRLWSAYEVDLEETGTVSSETIRKMATRDTGAVSRDELESLRSLLELDHQCAWAHRLLASPWGASHGPALFTPSGLPARRQLHQDHSEKESVGVQIPHQAFQSHPLRALRITGADRVSNRGLRELLQDPNFTLTGQDIIKKKVSKKSQDPEDAARIVYRAIRADFPGAKEYLHLRKSEPPAVWVSETPRSKSR